MFLTPLSLLRAIIVGGKEKVNTFFPILVKFYKLDGQSAIFFIFFYEIPFLFSAVVIELIQNSEKDGSPWL